MNRVANGVIMTTGGAAPKGLFRSLLRAAPVLAFPFLGGCGEEDERMPPLLSAPEAEQRMEGENPPAELVESFDGLGFGFDGPHGPSLGRNPSDNSLAVGPNHIVQTVNSRLAIFTKKGDLFGTTGETLYGAVPTNTVFHGFGGTCEERNNGDAVVRYDQLADRWLIVMPIFRRGEARSDQPVVWTGADSVYLSPPGVMGQPGAAAELFVPEPVEPTPLEAQAELASTRSPRRQVERPAEPDGVFSMCYAVSTGPDPMGSYYRYEFLRPLFPDYPRPAVWPDGYYVPTSTGDNVVQKHACVVDRRKMLIGAPATEQCFVLDGVNFLNNADLDGTTPPPTGTPNVMMATGGTQLDSLFSGDGIYAWQFSVDWTDPNKSNLVGPDTIPVAPYHYLCDGQLTDCVPQPSSDQRLDSQGDKIMSRLVYRNLGGRQSIVGVHSVATEGGAGGVRWYEFGTDTEGGVWLRQQGTYAPGGGYRWMASPAIDRFGNIGIGYSFGGPDDFPGQRFAARMADDPLGQLTLQETLVVKGEGPQTNTLRWEDYTQTAIDPDDDCSIWYVGDYFKVGAPTYSTRIGMIRLPGCPGGD